MRTIVGIEGALQQLHRSRICQGIIAYIKDQQAAVVVGKAFPLKTAGRIYEPLAPGKIVVDPAPGPVAPERAGDLDEFYRTRSGPTKMRLGLRFCGATMFDAPWTRFAALVERAERRQRYMRFGPSEHMWVPGPVPSACRRPSG